MFAPKMGEIAPEVGEDTRAFAPFWGGFESREMFTT